MKQLPDFMKQFLKYYSLFDRHSKYIRALEFTSDASCTYNNIIMMIFIGVILLFLQKIHFTQKVQFFVCFL